MGHVFSYQEVETPETYTQIIADSSQEVLTEPFSLDALRHSEDRPAQTDSINDAGRLGIQEHSTGYQPTDAVSRDGSAQWPTSDAVLSVSVSQRDRKSASPASTLPIRPPSPAVSAPTVLLGRKPIGNLKPSPPAMTRMTMFVLRSRRLMQKRIKTAERRRKAKDSRSALKKRLRKLHDSVSDSAMGGSDYSEGNDVEESLEMLWERVEEAETTLERDDEELAVEEAKLLRLAPSIFSDPTRSLRAPLSREQLDYEGDDDDDDVDLDVAMDYPDPGLDPSAYEILGKYQEENQLEDRLLRISHRQTQLMTAVFDQEAQTASESDMEKLDALDEERATVNERLAAIRAKREQLLDHADSVALSEHWSPPYASSWANADVRSLPPTLRPETTPLFPTSASIGNILNLAHQSAMTQPAETPGSRP